MEAGILQHEKRREISDPEQIRRGALGNAYPEHGLLEGPFVEYDKTLAVLSYAMTGHGDQPDQKRKYNRGDNKCSTTLDIDESSHIF